MNPDFMYGGCMLFFRLISGACGPPWGVTVTLLRHNRTANASKIRLPALLEASRDTLVALLRFSPLSLVWFWCVGSPAVEPAMKQLMRAFCQWWADSPSGVGGNVTDAEQLTAWAFEALQVTLGYCLLMEFSVWGLGG